MHAGWRPAGVAVHVEPEGGLNSAKGSSSWSVEITLPWSLLQQAANRQVPPANGEVGPDEQPGLGSNSLQEPWQHGQRSATSRSGLDTVG